MIKGKAKQLYEDLNVSVDAETGNALSATMVKGKINAALTLTSDDIAFIKKEITEQLLEKLKSSNEVLNKYAKLMASIILAEDSNDIKDALEGAAMKTGGYLVRQKSHFSTSVTFYPGFELGRESLSNGGQKLPNSSETSVKGNYLGVALPIGIEAAAGLDWKAIGAIGVFLQVLDLGAVLNYSLNTSGEDSISTLPEFGFKQVLSPGAYLTIHFANNPITLGTGWSFSPDLRTINGEIQSVNVNSTQFGFFLAVDLNVFPIYASRKKHRLKTKSFRKAYDK